MREKSRVDVLARLLCDEAASVEGHSWMLSNVRRGDGPCSAHRSQAARLVARGVLVVTPTGSPEPLRDEIIKALRAIEAEAITPHRFEEWVREAACRGIIGGGSPEPSEAAIRDAVLRDLWNGDIALNAEQRIWIRQALDAQDGVRGESSEEQPR